MFLAAYGVRDSFQIQIVVVDPLIDQLDALLGKLLRIGVRLFFQNVMNVSTVIKRGADNDPHRQDKEAGCYPSFFFCITFLLPDYYLYYI